MILFSVWQLRRHCVLLPLLPFSLLPTPFPSPSPSLPPQPVNLAHNRPPSSASHFLLQFPSSLSHNKPPSSVIFSVGLPSPVPANTPGADLALTNLTYCSSSDRHNFAVPGSKLLSLVANSGSVCHHELHGNVELGSNKLGSDVSPAWINRIFSSSGIHESTHDSQMMSSSNNGSLQCTYCAATTPNQDSEATFLSLPPSISAFLSGSCTDAKQGLYDRFFFQWLPSFFFFQIAVMELKHVPLVISLVSK
ncbi:hypothetical protein OIU84_001588 [Salix udensis]|uniref:Uncharacterized protein n=1 Tax=Salix udensis TaxID=889485 RepID=A0AAD6P6R9_9ROSI|nr:hypothetical protein OIU84_001588 [Salix udensis]